MPPNFLSKFVKATTTPSSSPSRPSTSSSRNSSPVRGHAHTNSAPSPGTVTPLSDYDGPSVTVVPPSPIDAVMRMGPPSEEDLAEFGAAVRSRSGSRADRDHSDYAQATTPTPQNPSGSPPVGALNSSRSVKNSSSASDLRSSDSASSPPTESDRFASPPTSLRGNASAHGRAATDSQAYTSKRTAPSNISTDENGSAYGVMAPIVESPTGTKTEFFNSASLASSASTRLAAPDASDAASIYSTASGSGRKRRPWRRGTRDGSSSTVSSPGSPPKKEKDRKRDRQPTGLASALASSGLALANPMSPPPPLAPMPTPASGNMSPPMLAASLVSRRPSIGSMNRHAAAQAHAPVPRTSLDSPEASLNRSRRSHSRSRATSISQVTSEGASDVTSDSGDDFGDSDDDELDLDDDIPVTGFAVASSKRNADFHELFPTIPEGDYLIEDYGCALARDILVQGRLYISENHLCFHANIFGWITDLSIPICDITGLEKKMTALIIPNAIGVSTHEAKYTFASFMSRDTTFDVIYNVWRLARPSSALGSQLAASASLIGSLDEEPRAGMDAPRAAGSPGPSRGKGPVARKITQCACGKKGEHYSETMMEVILPGTPEKIYNLLFASGFIKDFMRDDQKLIDIQISDWEPGPGGSKLLCRNMSYIKPLNGSIGPKQTKCELRDETVHFDIEDYISTVTTTRTPDVPSGTVFAVKTRTCITWASQITTKVVVTTQVDWTGRSFIKSIIERSAIDGQRTYHVALDKAMRSYIHDNKTEFVPEGVDPDAVVEEETPLSPSTPSEPAESLDAQTARLARDRERNQRGLQWAYDTFEGALSVAKQSTSGALELLGDAWESSSSTTILYFAIVFLVISNVWTMTAIGGREEAGRRKELKKSEEREKWIQGIVTTLWEELAVTRSTQVGLPLPAALRPNADWRDETVEINKALDLIEARMHALRQGLNELE